MKTSKFSVVILLLISIAISSCGGGGGGETNSGDLIAEAGHNQTIRSGSQTILSGKNSEKKHAITKRTWVAISDLKGGKLVPQKNKGAAKFIAPKLTTTESFEFGYTLEDVKGNTSKDKVTITVVPGDDSNRFLNQNFRDRERLEVVVGTENALDTLQSPVSFDITLDILANYSGKSVAVRDEFQQVSGQWVSKTGGPSATSSDNPSVFFALPALYLSDLEDIIAQTVLPDEVTGELLLSASSSDDKAVPFLSIFAGEELLASGKAPLKIPYDKARTIFGTDSRQRAEQYYDKIDPEQKKLTLCNWKFENGITPEIEQEALSNGTVQMSGGQITHQKYINGYDLGFGRDMYLYRKNSGELVAWVVNYPSMDAMENHTDAIATVVMEYGPLNGVGQSFTRFYTYVESPNPNLTEAYLLENNPISADDPCYNTNGTPKGNLGLDPADFRRKLSYGLDFDGRGYRYMPEACTVCHGGIGPAEELATNGDLKASFLPWDVENLFLSDDNFETRPKSHFNGELRSLLRATSDDNFKALNESVLFSRDNDESDPIRNLIHGWYGGNVLDNSLPTETVFNGEYVPEGWKGNPDMYTEVVAPMCRTCHIAREESSGLAFTSDSQLSAYINDKSRSLIEDERLMPLARLTMDNLWGELDGEAPNTGLQVLSDYLGGNLKRSVRPFGVISAKAGLNVKTGAPLVIDAFSAHHFETLNWTISPSDGATLSSNSALQTIFTGTKEGSYKVTLSLKNGDQTQTDNVSITVSGTPPIVDPGGQGNVQNGKSKFRASCESCHSTPDGGGATGPNLTCAGEKVVNNLGTISSSMSNISLSDKEVLDVRAYLDSFNCSSVENTAPVATIKGTPEIRAQADDENPSGEEFKRLTLDGSGSTDKETPNDLKYEWSCGGSGVLGTAATYTRAFTVGQCDWKLKVIDPSGASDTETIKVIVTERPKVGTARFEKDLYEVNEGDGQVVLNIQRVDGSSGELKLHFRTPGVGNGVDAQFRVDYLPIDDDENIRFANGGTKATITFNLNDDADEEGGSGGFEESFIELWTGFEGEANPKFMHKTRLVIFDNDVAEPVNTPPKANAGPDQTVTDSDGNGSQFVDLDGSGSSDTEDNKSELKYRWTLNGNTLGTAATIRPSLQADKTHTITLRVTDTDDASSTDTVSITVKKKEKTAREKGRDLFKTKTCTGCHNTADYPEPDKGGPTKISCGNKTRTKIESMLTNNAGVSFTQEDVTNLKAYLACT